LVKKLKKGEEKQQKIHEHAAILNISSPFSNIGHFVLYYKAAHPWDMRG
jgi:hypothetical protein